MLECAHFGQRVVQFKGDCSVPVHLKAWRQTQLQQLYPFARQLLSPTEHSLFHGKGGLAGLHGEWTILPSYCRFGV